MTQDESVHPCHIPYKQFRPDPVHHQPRSLRPPAADEDDGGLVETGDPEEEPGCHVVFESAGNRPV